MALCHGQIYHQKSLVRKAHCEFWLGNGIGKTRLWKKLFYSTNKDEIKEERILEIAHSPFEGGAEPHL